jgi:hypothetical protein
VADVALPGVVSALVLAFQGLSGLAGVLVDDSSSPSGSSAKDIVTIGDDGDPESDTVATYEQEWANFSQTRAKETGSIPCAVIAQSGSTKIDSVRVRAGVLLNVCAAYVKANPTLDGQVSSMRLSAGDMMPVQTDLGAAIIAPFTITYWTQI